ncbi:Manganese-dependent inorganic pyrophosphatase [Lachnospiraceae bacterium TWA4]|nr:Manganese-dependent inorganic pyrophosphatase [Lachnospiraceae bacterium TWA4]
MEQKSSNLIPTVTVVGHMNPDTDSICSAIAYAKLKTKLTGICHKPRRAGQINSETAYVLDYFEVQAPTFIGDVRPRIKDIEIRRMEGLTGEASLRQAWQVMTDNNVVTLPIFETTEHLQGLITMGDITRTYMEVFDNKIIGIAKTPYQNILDSIAGEMVVGNPTGSVTSGKVIIAAANPDVMENYIEKDDIVILGNRYESQLCAIEMGAQCIIISNETKVSKTITKLAQENNCRIIISEYDTYTIARLMNQSLPIRHFMCPFNKLISFSEDDFVEDVKNVMTEQRHRYFPILGLNGEYVGIISRRNLLKTRKRKMILVDHNERSQAVKGLEEAEILEIIDHHRIGSLETLEPVYFRNQPLGCTATIIYQIYQENGLEPEKEVAGLLLSAILSDTLAFRSPTCTPVDKQVATRLAKLAGISDIEAYACDMFAAGSNLGDKTAKEIFLQDFKKFNSDKLVFGVGQISSMSLDELLSVKEKLLPEMEAFMNEQKTDMLFFLLTNIMKESSILLCVGDDSETVVSRAFDCEVVDGCVELDGVVSRKKQFIPKLMLAFQEK